MKGRFLRDTKLKYFRRFYIIYLYIYTNYLLLKIFYYLVDFKLINMLLMFPFLLLLLYFLQEDVFIQTSTVMYFPLYIKYIMLLKKNENAFYIFHLHSFFCIFKNISFLFFLLKITT